MRSNVDPARRWWGLVLRWPVMPLALGLAWPGTSGCGGESPPPAKRPELEWADLKTGKGCVEAKVACGPGNCAARVHNGCDEPVTCNLSMESICRAQTGEEGPATATSGEITILDDGGDGLAAEVVCSQGEVLATIARTVTCF